MTSIDKISRRAFMSSCAVTLLLQGCGNSETQETGGVVPDPANGTTTDGANDTAAPANTPVWLDATAQAELVANGDLTALELVDAAIARIEAVNPKINAICARNFDGARARAAQPMPDGPFKGVPFLLKDLIEYPGLPFMRGTRMMRNQIGEETPELVAAYEKAGLIIVGKTTTPEFGFTASTEPVITGATRNPWNTDHTCGGSSGGAAAAVAAGILPIAHASDGGGSIRMPASCCGLFGLKPSRGRLIGDEDRGATDLAVENAVSRTVRDSARLLAATERTDTAAPLAPTGLIETGLNKPLKIGFLSDRFDGSSPNPDVMAGFQSTVQLCEDLGHTVSEFQWPFAAETFMENFILLWASGANWVYEYAKTEIGRNPTNEILENWTLGLAELYRSKGESGLQAASAFFQNVVAQLELTFKTYDVILTPTLALPPPTIGVLDPMLDFERHLENVLEFVGYTPVFNISGGAAMSVPLHWSQSGLPIGMQFAGPVGSEALLLKLAYDLENARPWADKYPPVWAG